MTEPRNPIGLAVLCHLSALLWIVIQFLIPPLVNSIPGIREYVNMVFALSYNAIDTIVANAIFIFPPYLLSMAVTYIIWKSECERNPLIAEQGRESINSQITFLMYRFLVLALHGFSFKLAGMFFKSNMNSQDESMLRLAISINHLAPTLQPLINFFQIVFVLLAVYKVTMSRSYRYPLTLRILR